LLQQVNALFGAGYFAHDMRCAFCGPGIDFIPMGFKFFPGHIAQMGDVVGEQGVEFGGGLFAAQAPLVIGRIG